jgi:hypothetical protein
VVIDVLLDLHDSTVEVITSNFWGCLTDFASDSSQRYCNGKLPATISDAEIKNTSHAVNDKYEGHSSFTINRYSGSMDIIGGATSKPNAGANWYIIISSAKLQCTRPEKIF